MKSGFLLIITAIGIIVIITTISLSAQPSVVYHTLLEQDPGLRLVDADLPPKNIQRVLDLCACQESGGPCIQPIFLHSNETHSIDTTTCE